MARVFGIEVNHQTQAAMNGTAAAIPTRHSKNTAKPPLRLAQRCMLPRMQWPKSSSDHHRLAAIEIARRTGNESRLLRGEISDSGGHILHPAMATHRDGGEDTGAFLLALPLL